MTDVSADLIARSCLGALLVLVVPCATSGQALSTIEGRVLDSSDSVLPDAVITLRQASIAFAAAEADDHGRYRLTAIPAGIYEMTAAKAGFQSQIIETFTIDAGTTVVRDFRLSPLGLHETVRVQAEAPAIDRAALGSGDVVSAATVQTIPLNGRHLVDLGTLVPGAVAPSQTGFSTTPSRGYGALAFNLSGHREEAVAYAINGVSTNNLTFGSLIYEPPLASVAQITLDRSPFGPDQGHVSGAILHVVTRSGTDEFRGEAFEFGRDDALDARNFFEFTTDQPHAFTRHQFGGTVGGPVRRGQTFFFTAYEGLRQRQAVDMNSLVLSDEQRASASDPIIQRLIPLIPRANFFDADGTPRFVGSAPAVADTDRWTVDVRHNLRAGGGVHVFAGGQALRSVEPASQGNSIPGFGHVRQPSRRVLTVNHTGVIGGSVLNEARFGRTRHDGGTQPAAALNQADFGIANGVVRSIGLPQFVVAGGLNFGGPALFPQARSDTLYVLSDTLTRAGRRHAVAVGGEYRHFINANVVEGSGLFNFPSIAAFLAATANAFSITLGERTNVIDQRGLALFARDRIELGSRLTVELGVRYEWHVTPTERENRFIVFEPARAALVRVGVDLEEIHRQNRNLEPRVGLAWDVAGRGRTVARIAYGRTADQPGTTAVKDTSSNPPFASPLTGAGSIALGSALEATRPAGLAPVTIDHAFGNAVLDSWTVNLQQQVSATTAITVGYFGSRGRNLRLSRNINQPVNGVRPFEAVSASSPLLPGIPLGVITQVESTGFSAYDGAWVSWTRRLSGGLQVEGSYTWSKSLDTNSLNSSGFAIQDSYDIANQYGPSDFDARHRFVLSAVYALPFSAHAWIRGWQVAAVAQSQSGNPINITTSNSTLNGLPNTVRPDVTGPVRVIRNVDRWFDPSVFVAVDRFGNLGRNAITGPAFHNTDVSLSRAVRLSARAILQLRVDIFNVFNTVNFGPPGSIVGTPTFGKITRTRLPTGEAGSSRQIQFAVKASF